MNTLRALLLADDDERRAVERTLHDGIQQQLVALAMCLQLASGLVETDPQEAARLLDEARSVAAAALEAVRQVAERIHPPLLDTEGLLSALRMAAASAPIPARAEGVWPSVSPAVAVTLYRCCIATLASVRGEDPRATFTVRTMADGLVEFEVVVAGGVVDAGALDPVAARVEALGGTLETTTARVTCRLPPGT